MPLHDLRFGSDAFIGKEEMLSGIHEIREPRTTAGT